MEKARRDLRLSELSIQEEFYDEAAFHAQQAAEKALKALISAQGRRPPKTHDIDVLLFHLRGLNIEWEEDLSALTAYSVEARYPGPPISLEEAVRAFEVAEKTFRQIAENLEVMGIKC